MGRRTTPLGEVIAERRLKAADASGRAVVVALGKPRQIEANHWECPFRINGAGVRHAGQGSGVDAFQALTLALEGIRRFLDQLETPVVWDGVFDDHSGFQRLIPMIPDARRGTRVSMRRRTQRLERIVDREVRQWAQDMKRRYLAAQRRRRAKPSRPGR